ncbi:S8 family serine peptidase, partial [Kordia zhangzhouensis]|uniref:S8 family serine peptidase n=1 Tax=Kordia zhangzhouensis TaxID=1620405 RepID=UPI00138E02AE
MDIFNDTIPGISLNRAYKELISKSKYKESITIAIIDSELDIDHPDLKNQIWTNTDEVPNNGLDDDNNGYIDDMHGWNFIGTNGQDEVPYTSFSSTRIIKKYKPKFKNFTKEKISKEDLKYYNIYIEALRVYDQELSQRKRDIEMYKRMIKKYRSAEIFFDSLFNNNYSLKQLDSLKRLSKKGEVIFEHANNMHYYLKYGYTPIWLNDQISYETNIINTLLNFDHDDRALTEDNPFDILDTVYGNNHIQGTRKLNHATKVASIIAAEKNNDIGIDGITNDIKIMSLGVTAAGDEFDKDIALAIRYAVNNGARIINLSIGREISLFPEWINEEMKYAEQNDVLIITSAGNNGYNLDIRTNFPNDTYNSKEFLKNFIKVGNISYKLDSTIVNSYSNYGSKEVDIFAPGTAIYTDTRTSEAFSTGTSYSAPIVSGIAVLIRSYYPNLTAAEVKQILLESGVSLDLLVLKPFPDGEKRDPNKVP